MLAHEAPRLLSGVSSVRGVKGVENALTVHTEAENISSLQGGRPRTGDRFALMQTNWSPTARLLAGLAGGALMANCLARRSLLGVTLGAVGAGLFMRSATNMDMKSLRRRSRPPTDQGAEDDQHPCAGRTSLRFFDRSPEFSARYVQVREARPMGDGRSHWVVAGPVGASIEWTAEVTQQVPNNLLAWRSLPGSTVRHNGVVHFEPVHEGSTRVHIQADYYPPCGVIGHTLAKLFGFDPKSEMDADLLRMKTFIEKGRTPHDAAIRLPAGREAEAYPPTHLERVK